MSASVIRTFCKVNLRRFPDLLTCSIEKGKSKCYILGTAYHPLPASLVPLHRNVLEGEAPEGREGDGVPGELRLVGDEGVPHRELPDLGAQGVQARQVQTPVSAGVDITRITEK